MYDRDLVIEIVRQLLAAAQTISQRFTPITASEDFTASDAGREKLDAICMQLIAIGESVKRLDKLTQGELLSQYPAIEWRRVMGMRDVLSHHYFDIDAAVVYTVCVKHIHPLADTFHTMLIDLADSPNQFGS